MSTPTPPIVSPPGSLAGYSFKTFLIKNKDKLKLMISALGAFGIAQIGLIQNPGLNTMLSTLAGAVLYLLTSAIDYWLTDETKPQ